MSRSNVLYIAVPVDKVANQLLTFLGLNENGKREKKNTHSVRDLIRPNKEYYVFPVTDNPQKIGSVGRERS